jgi:hypothetical protein
MMTRQEQLAASYHLASTSCSHPTPQERRDEVAKIARRLWEQRGGGDSTQAQQHDDWVRAEEIYSAGGDADPAEDAKEPV